MSVTGSLESHRASGFYLDARGAVTYVQRHARPGDAVFATTEVAAKVPLIHYGIGALHPICWVPAEPRRWPAPGGDGRG